MQVVIRDMSRTNGDVRPKMRPFFGSPIVPRRITRR